jgi:hypothetical protein
MAYTGISLSLSELLVMRAFYSDFANEFCLIVQPVVSIYVNVISAVSIHRVSVCLNTSIWHVQAM